MRVKHLHQPNTQKRLVMSLAQTRLFMHAKMHECLHTFVQESDLSMTPLLRPSEYLESLFGCDCSGCAACSTDFTSADDDEECAYCAIAWATCNIGYSLSGFTCAQMETHGCDCSGCSQCESTDPADEVSWEFDDASGGGFRGGAPVMDIFHTFAGEIFGAPSPLPTASPAPSVLPTSFPSPPPSALPIPFPSPPPSALPTPLPSTGAPSPLPSLLPSSPAPSEAPSPFPSNGCNGDDGLYLYKLIMTDTGGDGWGGVTYTITTGGTVRFSGSLANGYSGFHYLCLGWLGSTLAPGTEGSTPPTSTPTLAARGLYKT